MSFQERGPNKSLSEYHIPGANEAMLQKERPERYIEYLLDSLALLPHHTDRKKTREMSKTEDRDTHFTSFHKELVS